MVLRRWIEDLSLQVQDFVKHGSTLNKLYFYDLLEVHKEVMLGANGNSAQTGLLFQWRHTRNKNLITRPIMTELMN